MNKINIGDFHQEKFIFTQDDVNIFMKLTGDYNPIHFDIEAAKHSIFKRPIIHGFLSSSIFSKVLGINLPGKGTIYLKQEIKFLKPMFVDTNYVCKIEVIDVNNDIYTLKTCVFNEENEMTIDGLAIVLNKS